MPNNATYTVAGISFYRGQFRLRTSNNLAERQKTLLAMGDTEINLVELPRPMTKAEIVLWLSRNPDFDSEDERALLARLRAKWHLDKPAAETTAQTAPKAAKAQAAQPHKDPNWEPDF